jgi:hypothetical protein
MNLLKKTQMKTHVLFLTLCGLSFFALQAQDITSNLEVRYQFDYTNGDTYLYDYSENRRHISPSSDGIAQDWSSMQFGTDLIGTIVQPYVYFPAGRANNVYFALAKESNYWQGITGDVARTFCAWFKIDADAAEYDGKLLFSYGDENQSGGKYRIVLKGKSVEFENAVNTPSNDWCNRNVGWLDSYLPDTWHHLALVYDGEGGRQTGFSLYIDGNKTAFDPVSGTSPDYSINTAALYDPEIGRYMEKMSIADLRFYSRMLTEEEVNLVKNDELPTLIASPTKTGGDRLYYRNQSLAFISPRNIEETIELSVYNATGQLEQKTRITAKETKFTIPYQPVGNGLKIVRLQGKSLNITAKILIK